MLTSPLWRSPRLRPSFVVVIICNTAGTIALLLGRLGRLVRYSRHGSHGYYGRLGRYSRLGRHSRLSWSSIMVISAAFGGRCYSHPPRGNAP